MQFDGVAFSAPSHCRPVRQHFFCDWNFSPITKMDDVFYL